MQTDPQRTWDSHTGHLYYDDSCEQNTKGSTANQYWPLECQVQEQDTSKYRKHGSIYGWKQKQKQKILEWFKGTCNYCSIQGHKAADCHKKKPAEKNKTK